MARCSPQHPVCGEGWRKNGRREEGQEGQGQAGKDKGDWGRGPSLTAFLGTQLAGSFQPSLGLWPATAPGLGGVETFGY